MGVEKLCDLRFTLPSTSTWSGANLIAGLEKAGLAIHSCSLPEDIQNCCPPGSTERLQKMELQMLAP